MSRTKELLETKISKLIEQVESAGSWKKPFKEAMASGVPMNHITSRHYKGSNIFFLWMQANEKGYQSNNWLTYKQCMQAGARINKGEKATSVFFYKPVEVKGVDTNGDEVLSTLPILKLYHVFNIDQTTLKPKEKITSKVDPISSCENFFDESSVCEIKEGSKAYYSVLEDYISIPNIDKFTDAQNYYATLAHELIHATGNTTRLDRDMSNKYKAYAYEELIAELGASFLSAHLGIDGDDIQDNAAAYLKHWLGVLKSDHRYLWKAMSEASKAYEYSLDAQSVEFVA